MAEKQNIEWKAIWKDEYLAWICGFANAQGGKLYVGVDDEGTLWGFLTVESCWKIFRIKFVMRWG